MAESSAEVSAGAERFRARFAALVVDVLAVVRVTDSFARVTTLQPIRALAQAAALRRIVEVLGRPGFDLRLGRMILTGQAQRLSEADHLPRLLRHPAPQLAVPGQVLEVADEVESDLGARQGDADSVFVADESDAGRLGVLAAAAADQR